MNFETYKIQDKITPYFKMKHIYIALVMILIANQESFAQQDAQYTQYMYNTMSVNPAYAGSREAISITGLYRNQWVGIGGAPVTQTLNINSPIGPSEKVGLGLSLINDKIGPTRETYIDIDVSYTINTSEDGELSFGVKAGGHLLDVDFKALNQYVDSDNLLEGNIENKFSPNFGAGVYYHKDNYYVGFSVPNLLETQHFNESNSDSSAAAFLAEERMNFYLIGGYVFDATDDIKLKPAVLFKAVAGSPLQADFSANAMYKDRFILGLAYRWSAAFSVMAGFQANDSMMLGFAYDRETSDLGNTEFNGGSYEFILRYEIFKKPAKVVYPRFF